MPRAASNNGLRWQSWGRGANRPVNAAVHPGFRAPRQTLVRQKLRQSLVLKLLVAARLGAADVDSDEDTLDYIERELGTSEQL